MMKRVVVKKSNSNGDVYAKGVVHVDDNIAPTSTSHFLRNTKNVDESLRNQFADAGVVRRNNNDQKKSKAKQDVDQLEKTVDETIKDTLKRIAKKRQQLKEIRDENADLKLTLERVRVRYMTTVWWIIMSCAWWLRLVTARDRQYLLYILCDVAFLANFRQVARTILLFVFKIIFSGLST